MPGNDHVSTLLTLSVGDDSVNTGDETGYGFYCCYGYPLCIIGFLWLNCYLVLKVGLVGQIIFFTICCTPSFRSSLCACTSGVFPHILPLSQQQTIVSCYSVLVKLVCACVHVRVSFVLVQPQFQAGLVCLVLGSSQ